ATIPTADVAALRRFYEGVLGFPFQRETPTTVYYDAGGGTFFAGSPSAGEAARRPPHMAFPGEAIQDGGAGPPARGGEVAAYETPKTVDGVADVGAGWAAWLKDPDGNLIGIWQFKPGT